MKNVKNKLTRKMMYAYNTVLVGAMMLVNTTGIAASLDSTSGAQNFDKFIQFACDWLVKIGGVVALVGGVMFALGWQREDAEGKSRGMMTAMAGFMLVAIGEVPQIFGVLN